MADKRILMIASNPATSPITGWPVGFWWAELTHALNAFERAGYRVTIASPEGGDLQGDAMSDPEDESGYSADDAVSLRFKNDPDQMTRLKGTPSLSDIDPDMYDAIFVVGGQGPMVTMADDEAVHRFVAAFHETGKVTAAVCHGACVLLKAKRPNGDLVVKGRRWTGFANAEEAYVEKAVGQPVQPFWIETEAGKLADTTFVTGGAFEPFAVRDGNLITGQQQVSSTKAAEEVLAALADAPTVRQASA